MFTILQRLVSAVPAAPQRTSITPGRLYAKMSEEFRAHRAAHGCNCVMPLPITNAFASTDECNWHVEPLWSQCADCDEYLPRLVARFAARYDVHDPVSETPVSSLLTETILQRLG